jgi:hypothetical protein
MDSTVPSAGASGDVFAASPGSIRRQSATAVLIPHRGLHLRILPAQSTAIGVTLWATNVRLTPSAHPRENERINSLSFVRAIRNGDVKPLDLFAVGGEIYLQFKPIVVGGIRFRPIERDQGGKFGRQALLDIGRFECRATHSDGAMFGRNGEADCGQRPAVQSARTLV